MKDRKKHRGTKAEIRAYKKRLQHIATIVTVAILVAIIACMHIVRRYSIKCYGS